jgi:tetratricopeptide (TPR) repeat protein
VDLQIAAQAKLADSDWLCLLPALRQEPKLWQELQETDLGSIALQVLPPDLGHWSPAVLALLAGAIAIAPQHLEHGLEAWKERFAGDPASLALSEAENERAVQVYEEWQQAQEMPTNLAEAGWIAHLLKGKVAAAASESKSLAWDLLADEPRLNPRSIENIHSAGLVLTCLYGMAPNPVEMLAALLCKGFQPALLVHALLGTPAYEDAQAGLLLTLLDRLDPGQAVAVLQALASQRSRLAASLARVYSGDSNRSGEQAAPSQFFEEVITGKRDKNAGTLTAAILQLSEGAQLFQLAGQPGGAIPLLAEAIRSSRRLQGQLSAQLACTLTLSRENDQDHPESLRKRSIEAWRQAVQMTPDSTVYSAELALALIDAGRVEEAHTALQPRLPGGNSSPHPRLLLASALQAQRAGQEELANQAALRALETAEKNRSEGCSETSCLDLNGAKRLARYFWQAGMLAEVERALQEGLTLSPSDPDLCWLAAQTYARLGKPQQALELAYIAQAATNFISADEARPADQIPAAPELQRLQINSLETLGAWDLAVDQRLHLIEAVERPDVKDLHALAESARRAGSAEKVIWACKRAVAAGYGSHAWVHQLLGESALEMADYPLAADHLRQAARLAPAQPELWLKLAETYQQLGQKVQAVDVLRLASQAVPEAAQVHLALGKAYREQQALTQALGSFRKAARLAPSDEARLNLAQVLFELGHLEEARNVLEGGAEGVAFLPGSGAEELKLTQTYAQVLLALGETARAVALLEKVVCAEPGNIQANLDLANGLMKNDPNPGAAQQALPLLERVLENAPEGELQRPEEQIAQALIAEARAVLGDYEQALQAYNRVLATGLSRQPGWRSRLALGIGRVAVALEQPEMALAALQEVARAEPLNLQVQRAMAEAFLASRLPEDAFQTARAILEISPSDMNTLTWFVELGTQIADQPGMEKQPVRPEVIRVLQRAAQLDPERSDLWRQLGLMHEQAGNLPAAREVYKHLAQTGDPQNRLQAGELHQAAVLLLQGGDAVSAALLLRIAIERQQAGEPAAESPGGENRSPVKPGELFVELSAAYQQAGNLDEALLAIERAISLMPDQPGLYEKKADLLCQAGKSDIALESLRRGLRLNPMDGGLHYRVAVILRSLNDLPGALSHAEKALLIGGDEEDVNMDGALRLLAAELSAAFLRPRQAWAYLEGGQLDGGSQLQSGSGGAYVLGIESLRAELALEAGDIEIAAQAVEKIARLAPDLPRTLAIQARLAAIQGNRQEAEEILERALLALEEPRLPAAAQPQSQAAGKRGGRKRDPQGLKGAGAAAAELGRWGQAAELTREGAGCSSSEPESALRVAQVLVKRAEAQRMFLALDVKRHDAGPDALEAPALQEFEEAILEAEKDMGLGAEAGPDGLPAWARDEATRTIAQWRTRGGLAFNPQLGSAVALGNLLKTFAPKVDDVTALVLGLCEAGEYASAARAAQTEWTPILGMPAVADQPQVMAGLAIAQEHSEPAKAPETAALARDKIITRGDWGWPPLPALHYLTARAALGAGQLPAALQAIGLALEIWPDEARWHALAAKIYLAADQALGLPDLAKAQVHLEKAASLEAGNFEHHYNLGCCCRRRGNLLRAIEALQEATRLAPDQPEPWMALAETQKEAGDLDGAAVSADHAAERANNPAQALLLRGEVALQVNNPRGALSRVQAVLRNQPEDTRALILLTRILQAMNRPAEALVALEKALPGLEDPLEMQLERVRLLRRVNGLEAALPALSDLAADYPDQAEILALSSEWLLEAGRQEEAVEAARRALQSPSNQLSAERRAGLYTLLGIQFHHEGQLDQAVYHLSEAVQLAPNQLDAYLELGKVYLDRREQKQAFKIYQKAIKVAPQDYRPYYQAGQALKEHKDYVTAETMLRHAAQLAPNEVSIHRLLGAVVALNLVHNRRS